MSISNFELLIGRIAPGPASPLNRRVVQGYFLTITNLDNRPVQLVIKMTSPAGGGTRQLDIGLPATASNTNVVFDNGTSNDVAIPCVITPSAVNTIAYRTQTDNADPLKNLQPIQPQQTMLITVLPNVGSFNFSGLGIEIRGYLEIRQEFKADGTLQPPAKLVITAEHRGTFLDNNFPGIGDYDQISYALPFGNGAAVQEIK